MMLMRAANPFISNLYMKRPLLFLAVLFLTLFLKPVSAHAAASAPSVETAVKKALSIASDDRHGYSQSRRWGNPDYDCSSFVYSVYYKAGFQLPDSGDRTTETMLNDFKKAGFQWISWSKVGGVANLKRGDILLNNGSFNRHAEIYIGGLQLVGAHHNYGSPASGDQSGKEISICGYFYHPWLGVLRYDGSKSYASALKTKLVTSLKLRKGTKTLKNGTVIRLKAGKQIKLKAVLKAPSGANKKLKWKSGNNKYAKVSQTGKIRALKAGKGKTVKITVMTTDGSNLKRTVKIRIR